MYISINVLYLLAPVCAGGVGALRRGIPCLRSGLNSRRAGCLVLLLLLLIFLLWRLDINDRSLTQTHARIHAHTYAHTLQSPECVTLQLQKLCDVLGWRCSLRCDVIWLQLNSVAQLWNKLSEELRLVTLLHSNPSLQSATLTLFVIECYFE